MKKLYLLLFSLVLLSFQSIGQIVITEISYNPPESGTDSSEYIELLNTTTSPINLTGYSFSQGVNYTFPNITIAAGEYIVIAVDSTIGIFPPSVQVYEWTSGGLSNGGEDIVLKDNSLTTIDSVDYDDSGVWPSGSAAGQPDGGGSSLVLCDPALDNNDGSNWFASQSAFPGRIINGNQMYGSPGAEDSVCLMSVSLSVINVSCNGGSDGSITATVSNGTAPLTFNWSSAGTTATISNLSAGSYTVTVTDNNANTAVGTAIVTEPAAVSVTAVVDSNVSVNGGSDGGASAQVAGGIAPYTYIWSNSATTASITGVIAGTYSVTVTDNNGCTGMDNVTITQPAPANINLNLNVIDASCNGASDGAVSVTVSGGTAPLTYLWSNMATGSNITNLNAGTYSVTVTDNNGVTAVGSATVNEPTPVNVLISLDSNASCSGSSDGGISAVASGGTAPYVYSWSNSAITPSINGLSTGTYSVTVTDNNGCTGIDSLSILSIDTVAPVVVTKDTTLYLDISGQLAVSGSDINAGSSDNCSIASYQVLNGNLDCSNIGANTVQLIAIDTDGNRDTASAVVTVVDSLGPTVLTQGITVYLGSNRSVSVTSTQLDNGTTDNCGLDSIRLDTFTFNCSNTGGNSVWVHAVDVNGNSDSATAIVTVIDTLPLDTQISNENGCGTYTWAQNGETYLASGTYYDTTRNALGCDTILHILNLNIDSVETIVETFNECDAYLWRDSVVYNSSNNTATFAIQNANGCDSIIYQLDLTINASDSSSVQDSACGSYTWASANGGNGQTYSQSGTYDFVLTNNEGCDSTISLVLEIRSLSLQVTNLGDSLFAFENHPQATYQWYDCSGDSAITGATSRGFKPDTTGFFSVIVGNGICSDTSSCQQVINIGLNERGLNASEVNLYPNPTTEDFFFEVDRMGADDQLMVFDMKGKLVDQRTVNQLKTKVETSGWDAGIYFVRYNDQVKKLVITK